MMWSVLLARGNAGRSRMQALPLSGSAFSEGTEETRQAPTSVGGFVSYGVPRQRVGS